MRYSYNNIINISLHQTIYSLLRSADSKLSGVSDGHHINLRLSCRGEDKIESGHRLTPHVIGQSENVHYEKIYSKTSQIGVLENSLHQLV